MLIATSPWAWKWGDKQHAGVGRAVRPLGRSRFGRGLSHAGGPALPETYYFLNFSPVSGPFRISTYSLIKGEKMPYMTSTSLGRMWLKSHMWIFSFDTEKYFFLREVYSGGDHPNWILHPISKGALGAAAMWAMGEAEASCPPLTALCLPGAGTGCPRDCRQRPPPAGPILLLCYIQIKKENVLEGLLLFHLQYIYFKVSFTYLV